MDASNEDDDGKMGWGPLDHLPDVGETVPGVLASSPTLPGGGGGGAAPGSVVDRLGAEADMLEEWVLGKHAVSPVGSAVVVEQVAVGVTQLPPQRTEGAPGSIEDQPALMNTEVVPLPPPPPTQTRVVMSKRLQPRSSRKQPTEVPTLAPLKVLKVNPSSSTHWVAEAQAALQCGAASARADPKEPATQGGDARAAPTQVGEGAPPPHDGEAHGSDGAEVPLPAEATGIEVLVVSQARAMEAMAPRTIEVAAAGVGAPATAEATVVEARAPETTVAMMAEAGAPRTTEANMIMARLLAQEVETKATEASVAPLVQGPLSLRESAQEVEVLPISFDDTSWA
ncbi:uncharacterized protein [Miscanthus floridulus]|uniref:uncharacterized protein n=1 Tax=Miscanthus floridulus TaxID=154761 RepID=UPI0034579936